MGKKRGHRKDSELTTLLADDLIKLWEIERRVTEHIERGRGNHPAVQGYAALFHTQLGYVDMLLFDCDDAERLAANKMMHDLDAG